MARAWFFDPLSRAFLLCEDQHPAVKVFSVASELKRVQAKDENEYTDFHMGSVIFSLSMEWIFAS
jgi:hypothetical protein